MRSSRPTRRRSPWTPVLFVLAVALATVPAGGAVAKPRATVPSSADAVRALFPGLTNAACPLPDVATGGQPDSAALVQAVKTGYRTVLDLRMPEEPRGFDEAGLTKRLGARYVNLPVSGPTLVDATFDAFRALMKDPKRRPMFLHCHSGNRVGALLIPYLVLDRKVAMDAAVQTAREVGMRNPALEEKARDYVARHKS